MILRKRLLIFIEKPSITHISKENQKNLKILKNLLISLNYQLLGQNRKEQHKE